MLTLASLVIGAHLHTVHVDSDKDLPVALRTTDHTPGLYLRTENGWTAGIARNSLGRASVYLAQTIETADGRFALTVGAITSYQYRNVYGQQACRKGYQSVPGNECVWRHGATNAVLRPLVAPSWAIHEAAPYLGGAVPRLVLLGKGLNISIEASF